MKTRPTCLACILSVLLLMGVAAAADNVSHTVTVTVNAINEIALTGGNITLTISTATAGSQPNNATNATTSLQWTVNTTSKKITVMTDQVTFNHTLKVLATGVTGGTAAAEVTISNTAQDYITGVATTLGGCTNNYTASVTAAQGTQSVAHTITYTITAAV